MSFSFPAPGLSHVVGAAAPLNLRTLGDEFVAAERERPDHMLAVDAQQGVMFTYRQIGAMSRALAAALIERGLKPGDRVGGPCVCLCCLLLCLRCACVCFLLSFVCLWCQLVLFPCVFGLFVCC